MKLLTAIVQFNPNISRYFTEVPTEPTEVLLCIHKSDINPCLGIEDNPHLPWIPNMGFSVSGLYSHFFTIIMTKEIV